MNFERDLGLSAPPSRRMSAARRLQTHPDEISMGDILLALEREPVLQIREQLSKVMQVKTESQSTPNNFVPRRSKADYSEASSEVLMHLAELIRHELAPSVGFLELAAIDEIDDFENSQTNRELKSLSQRIGGLSRLTSAHRPLLHETVDLRQMLENVAEANGLHEIVTVKSLSSHDQRMIATDVGLLELLLSNALRNAKEALDRLPGERRSIEVTYSMDTSGFWISVVNPFQGNEFTIDEVDRAGLSTKGLQRGYGVRIMKLISSRLSLTLSLRGANGIAQLVIQRRNDSAQD